MEKESVNATVPNKQIVPFVKTVWDIIDTKAEGELEGDKKLTPIELELAFEEPEKVDILLTSYTPDNVKIKQG